MKQIFEFFPLVIFFIVYYKSDKDLYLSIAAVIVATLISLAALYFKENFIFEKKTKPSKNDKNNCTNKHHSRNFSFFEV